MASSSFKVGDQVWVKTGVAVSASGEELGTITSLPTPQAGKKNCNTTNGNGEEVSRDDCIVIKYTVSGYDVLITDYNRIRHMEDPTAVDETDGKGRKLRRSGRSSSNPTASILMNLCSGTTDTKKFVANAAANDVTPSPTASSANGGDDDEVMEDSSKSAAAKKKETKKRKSVAKKPTAATSIKKAKMTLSSPLKGEVTLDDGEKHGKGSPYFAKEGSKQSSKTNMKEEGEKVPAQKKKKAAPKKKGGRKLIMSAPSSDSEGDDDDVEMDEKGGGKLNDNKKKPAAVAKTSAKKPASKGKNTTASSKTKSAAAAPTKNKKKESKTKKQSAASSSSSETDIKKKKSLANKNKPCSSSEGNQPDGNGGLNQPTPWIVEYSKTGRATCRSCDEKIGKGDVRVGHTPLFRGKPGFMVYRHLHCAVFSTDILCAEDVEGYEELNQEDYIKLAEQVDVSKEKIKEEQEEIRPDELVQKSFQGEMRSEPLGFAGTLLPFQVEGFSWMRHQEIMEKEVRGGILADEMGMGKTIQTIATILDNRPKLQHSKPDMKHPPTADLEQRQNEEKLWDETKQSWLSEMDLLKVSKKLRTRDGGARAGTLVICPVIALTQWRTEIEKFTESGTLSVCTYHGPDRESETPRALMKKYDVVLTTYQVLESDFRKMMSPNKVECPNCGGKFKIDKLPIHLKYFCGDNAERTEAQARQQRNSDRGGGSNNRGRGRGSSGGDASNNKKGGKKKKSFATKEKTADQKKEKSTKKKSADKKNPKTEKKAAKKSAKKASPKSNDSDDEMPDATVTPRAGSKRNAARKAASQISQSVNEWTPPKGESDSDGFKSDAESDEDSGNESSSEGDYDSESSDDSASKRAREKQRQALEMTKSKKKAMPKKKQPASGKGKAKGKKPVKKPAAKGKKKKFDDDSDDDYSSSDSSGDPEDEIDMAALIEKAMAGAKNSVLHSLCWWRIILDEAHFIKSRSSQTANAAFSLIGVNRWALSGTPLQNRVGEFYSLVRFLRLDPFASYFCRAKNCDCKSMHYLIHAGRCEGCGHSGIQHYSHFNKYILNPIQRDGYTGDGRRAMFLLKNEVLDKALLRRTKETKAADMELPPRLVQIKPVRLHPVEEDFYSALYTQTKSSFDDYVDSGTLLNNYAHIFDLLIRMRQSVDHPYLVVYSKGKKNTSGHTNMTQSGATAPVIANGSADCDLCHEPPTDRVVSTCCGAAYCRACVLEYMATTTSMAASENIPCPSCQEAFSIDLQARADLEDDCSLTLAPVAMQNDGSGANMPSLKELKHVATGSILRRINLADFATSSKIEALTRELVLMRQQSPGSKAIVFSQFVNMLDLIRWRLHSDPYLEDIGLGCRALHGGMNVKARDACLKDFRENNNVRVLLMSLKAGGVALNLTCANYIYLMDPWWNPAAEMQAIDRTHRLGQYRPIRAVRFIAENTVEERILQLQEKKRLVFDGTVGRDAGSLKMLTADDMKSLFA